MTEFATNNAPVEQPVEEGTNPTPQPVEQRVDINTTILDPGKQPDFNSRTLTEQAQFNGLRDQGQTSDLMRQLSNQNIDGTTPTINNTASIVADRAYEQLLKHGTESGLKGGKLLAAAAKAAELARHNSVTLPGQENNNAKKENQNENPAENPSESREAEITNNYRRMKEKLTA